MADAQLLPRGRTQAGDRHLNFHEGRDNLADITRGHLVRLPWDYPRYGRPETDNELIVDAVRASMSIPFFFDPVRLRAPAATVDGCNYEAGRQSRR